MGKDVERSLIVFDVEGVIIPKARFLLFDVFGKLWVKRFIRAALYGFLYWIGLVSLKRASEKIFLLLKGFPRERLITLFHEVPLMPSVESVFNELRAKGKKLALISSGIPIDGLNALAKRLGADYVSGVEIGVEDGFLTGKIWGDVLEPGGKALALKKLVGESELHRGCAVVADDRNNLPLFKICDLKIGFNPDFSLRCRADFVVEGELTEILQILEGNHQMGRGNITRNLLIREAIHMGGLLVPIFCILYFPPLIMASLIFSVTMLYIVSETLRMLGRNVPLFEFVTRTAAGKGEYHEFVTAPIFYAFGIIFALMLFPQPTGYVAIAVLTLGDGLASLAGRWLGERKISFNKNKSIEGSLAFIISAFGGALLFTDPIRAMMASAVGTIVEILPLPVNDNLAIPMFTGLTLMAFF